MKLVAKYMYLGMQCVVTHDCFASMRCIWKEVLTSDDIELSKRDFAKWRTYSAQERSKLGMSSQAKPWSGLPGVTCTGVGQCERMLDDVDVCFHVARQEAGPHVSVAEVKEDLFCNASQGVQRRPVTREPPLLCQKTWLYSYKADCVLSGRDHLALQGFPNTPNLAPPHVVSDREARALAGEAFYLPNMTTIAYAYYLNPKGPWWTTGTTASSASSAVAASSLSD